MIRTFLLASLSFLCASAVTATPFTFDDIVDSRDNLYYTDWGHWWTTEDDAALNAPGSNAARAVQLGGSSFDFSGFSTLQISASGIVQAHAVTESGPDGCLDCDFNDGKFRLLPAYSLIGIWSSSATQIVPFGDWTNLASGLGLLFIGSFAQLTIPDFPSAYLFLAENDGAFSDNFGLFDVSFSADVAEPGMLGLLFAGLLGISASRKRRREQEA